MRGGWESDIWKLDLNTFKLGVDFDFCWQLIPIAYSTTAGLVFKIL